MEILEHKSQIFEQLQKFRSPFIGIPRALPDNIHEHFKAKEVTIVTGVRRCGKSTLLKQVSTLLGKKKVIYFLDLESPFFVNFLFDDFSKIYDLWLEIDPPNGKEIVIFYDEIQNITGWEKWVRFLAEKENHKVFVSGSNSEMLSSELGTLLTGRHRTIYLAPFGIQELANYEVGLSKLKKIEKNTPPTLIRLKAIAQRMLEFGTFPRSYLDKSTTLLPLYYHDIITRDIIKRKKIRSSRELILLSELLAKECSRIFNRAKTAEILGIKDYQTINKYLEFFKECYLFYELRSYSPSLRKKLRSLSKFYCVDPKLPSTIFDINDLSASFENLVFLELKNLKTFKEISYWHSKNGFEIDFICEYKNELIAIQASYPIDNPKTLEREKRALIAGYKELDCKKLVIVTMNESQMIKHESVKIEVLPVYKVFELLT